MDCATLFLIALLLVVLLAYVGLRPSVLSRIPGPKTFALVGTWSVKPSEAHLQFDNWTKLYGPVFRIGILTQPVVVLNTYDTIREALFNKASSFSGRPSLHRADELQVAKGVAFQNSNDTYKHLRKTTLRSLKVHGTYLLQLENVVSEHLSDLVDIFRSKNGMAFNPRDEVYKFLYNIILSLLLGQKLSYNDPLFERLKEFNAAAVKAMSIGRENQDIFPRVSKLVDPLYEDLVKAVQLRKEVVEPLYKEHKATYAVGHERGILDVFIADVENHLITDENAIGVFLDYLVAGVETTATSLYGFLLLLLHNPQVQHKLQNEVDQLVGRDRSPSLTDRVRMPFTEATVQELLRYQTPIPVYPPHATTADAEVAGYSIPKGTWVLINAWSVNHNSEVYPEPFMFKPERFLNADGSLLPVDHPVRRNVLSFGIGTRHCPGEMLARNRLFLTLATLMQQFDFEPGQENPAVSADPRSYKLRIIFDIHDFTLKAIARKVQ